MKDFMLTLINQASQSFFKRVRPRVANCKVKKSAWGNRDEKHNHLALYLDGIITVVAFWSYYM
jgi:hypothetical protein